MIPSPIVDCRNIRRSPGIEALQVVHHPLRHDPAVLHPLAAMALLLLPAAMALLLLPAAMALLLHPAAMALLLLHHPAVTSRPLPVTTALLPEATGVLLRPLASAPGRMIITEGQEEEMMEDITEDRREMDRITDVNRPLEDGQEEEEGEGIMMTEDSRTGELSTEDWKNCRQVSTAVVVVAEAMATTT